jgi:hypothetical protein
MPAPDLTVSPALLPPAQCIPSTSRHTAEGIETSNVAWILSRQLSASVPWTFVRSRRPRFVRDVGVNAKGRHRHGRTLSAAHQCRVMTVLPAHTSDTVHQSNAIPEVYYPSSHLLRGHRDSPFGQ